MLFQEVNFDGLIGPSHNYAGLSPGNIASASHKGQIASPRHAALQGLEKMWRLRQLGQIQGVFPPAHRPDIQTLRDLGFSGSVQEVIAKASRQAPHLLAACYSASSMWAANAATVSVSRDCPDNRIHFTPANLITTLHRSIEPGFTSGMLKKVFSDPAHFCHHSPLPRQASFADEGAANHTRLSPDHHQPGITMLVYGQGNNKLSPKKFPARQSYAACEALVRQHNLPMENILLAQQNPEVIDLGVFHHDVIGVGHRHFLMMHQHALTDQTQVVEQLQQQWQQLNPTSDTSLIITEFSDDILSVSEAVSSYLFNSQLISLTEAGTPEQKMLLLAPTNCLKSNQARNAVNWLIEGDNPVTDVEYIDLSQSMNNGGGPACLRLRVTMSQSELKASHQGVLLNFELYTRLKNWIYKHYREELSPADLADPDLLTEIETALDELTHILDLNYLYPFQV